MSKTRVIDNVANILADSETARNCDITLCFMYWKTYETELLNESIKIIDVLATTNNLAFLNLKGNCLTSHASIIRARAKLQNEKKLYLSSILVAHTRQNAQIEYKNNYSVRA